MKILNLFLIFIYLNIYCQNNKDIFKVSTRDYAKSKGIDLDIYYPSSWELSIAKRPHVLFNVKSNDSKIYSTLSITDILENAPENVKKSFNELGPAETQKIIFSSFPNEENCKRYDFNQGMDNIESPVCYTTKLEGLPTSVSSFYGTTDRAGVVINSYMIVYQILYKTKTIIITFNFIDDKKDIRHLSDKISKGIINTIVLQNLYKK